MRQVDIAERRARLGSRHLLAATGTDVVRVTDALVGLHSSDPVTVYLSLMARIPGFEVGDLETALYDDRALVRMHGMRRTLWVVQSEQVPVIHHSSTAKIGETDRQRTIKILEEGGVTDDGASFLDRTIPLVLDSLNDRGELLTRELTAEIPELRRRIEFHNKAGELIGTTGAGSRVMNQLSLESRIVRTRPAGTWISGQYRWAPTETWLGEPIADLDIETASKKLVTALLNTFGPATETDLKWWTGWTLKQLRAAIAAVGAVDVEVETGVAYLLPDDLDPIEATAPWVAVLPSLDPTTMGWKERDWYLGDLGQTLFDRNGNAGPTIWVDGAVVGGWAQRSDGSVVYELLEDVPPERVDQIEDELGRLEAWLRPVTITPRFRSPHDKQLAG